VPQSRHVHALLAGGRHAFERLFPGFDDRMRAAGALELDFGLDFAALRPEGWMPREDSGIKTLFASRTLLESIVRDLLRAHPRVEPSSRRRSRDSCGRRGTARAVRLAGGERPRPGRRRERPDVEGARVACALGVDAPEETVVDRSRPRRAG
jgi:hypothetical protein